MVSRLLVVRPGAVRGVMRRLRRAGSVGQEHGHRRAGGQEGDTKAQGDGPAEEAVQWPHGHEAKRSSYAAIAPTIA
jgi:hypothetical protein